MLEKAVVLACCLLAACPAQESAPASKPESRIEFRLENGLRVCLVSVDLAGEFAVILGIRGAGILAEPAGVPHLAHISEHTLFYASRIDSPERALVERWFADGRANAETLPDFMYFDISPSTGHLNSAFAAQQTRFLAANIDAFILEREKPTALSEVTGLESSRTATRDALGKFAWSAFAQVAIHGKNEIAFRASTDAISTENVRAFHARTFRPEHAMITVVGDFDPLALMHAFDGMFERSDSAQKPEPESRPTLKPGTLHGTWDVASHQFFMAWPDPPPSDPAHPALAVLGEILYTKLTSTAGVLNLGRQPVAVEADVGGLFAIHMPLKGKDGGDAIAAEVRKVIDAVAKDESLLRALKGFKSNVRMNAGIHKRPMQYPPNIPRKIMAHANIELARMRATLAWNQSPEDYCARVDAVTADDIKTAIRTWLVPEKATIVTIAGKE